MAKLLIELVSGIIAAQASHMPMTLAEISDEVRYIYKVLQELQSLEADYQAVSKHRAPRP